MRFSEFEGVAQEYGQKWTIIDKIQCKFDSPLAGAPDATFSPASIDKSVSFACFVCFVGNLYRTAMTTSSKLLPKRRQEVVRQ